MESLKRYLERLRNILRFDEITSLLIYIVPSVILLVLSNIHPYLIVFYGLYMYYLYKRSRVIFYYSLFFSLFIFLLYVIDVILFRTYEMGSVVEGFIADKADNYLIIRKGIRYIKIYVKNGDEFLIGRKIIANVSEYVPNAERNVEGSFSYYRYKLSRNIIYECQSSKIEIKDKTFSIYLIKGLIVRYIESSFSDNTIKYLKRLVLGMNTFDSEINSYAQSTGIISLFCISGLHVSLFTSSIKKVLTKLDVPYEIISIIVVVTLLIYRTITLSQSSISRAIMMIVITEMFTLLNRRISKMDCLAVSFVISLLSNPFQSFQSGFYLTYLSTFTIYLMDEKSYIRQSIYVILSSTPIILYSNNGVSLFAILYSLVFSMFFSEIFIPLTYITLLFKDLDFIYELISSSLNSVLESMGNTNVFISFSIPNIYVLVSVYAAMCLMVTSMDDKRRLVTYSMVISMIIITGTLISRIAFFPVVEMMDVGQGDSFIVREGFKTFMIDTGVEDKYKTTIKYLKSKNINTINVLFLSHMDSDHSGDIENIEREMRVLSICSGEDGGYFEFGPLTLYTYRLESDDENESSMVIYMNCYGKAFLFTGDIESDGEDYILSNIQDRVDFLKIAHHGSKTSSKAEFIRKFLPKVSLISVGLNNRYGHPSKDVVERLESIDSKIYRTDLDGTTTITLFPFFSLIKTYRNDRILLFTYFKHMGLIID